MPVQLLAWIDLLGFLAFLAFLIANGIVAGHSWRTDHAVLLAYTSVPWMFSWYVALSRITEFFCASSDQTPSV